MDGGCEEKVELSEFHEGGAEWVEDRKSFVPHQSRDVLRRRKGKMGEVTCVVQR